jgi:predicted PurR-regulated permease PerM
MKAPTPSNTTTSSQLTTVLSYGAILLLGYFVFLIVEPFLVPLAWSAVLAIFFYPLHEKLLRKMKPTPAAMLSTLGVTVLLIAPALVVLVFTAREALDATARLQSELVVHGQGPNEGLIMRAEEWIRMRLPNSWNSMDISDPLQQAAERIASFLGSRFTGLLRNTVSFFLDLFIMIFAMFFMFRDGEQIVHGAKHLLPFDEDIQTDMLEESKELIFASVAVGLLVAAIQGLIAFFSLVPVVGSALIWGPAALWLVFSGHWGKALTVVVICGGISTIADNIVRPLLLRNRTRLNELLLFIGVLGGLEAFGLLGLVAGPTIVAAAMGVFRVYMEHREELAVKDT